MLLEPRGDPTIRGLVLDPLRWLLRIPSRGRLQLIRQGWEHRGPSRWLINRRSASRRRGGFPSTPNGIRHEDPKIAWTFWTTTSRPHFDVQLGELDQYLQRFGPSRPTATSHQAPLSGAPRRYKGPSSDTTHPSRHVGPPLLVEMEYMRRGCWPGLAWPGQMETMVQHTPVQIQNAIIGSLVMLGYNENSRSMDTIPNQRIYQTWREDFEAPDPGEGCY